jgi:hypothetical protein
LDEERSGPSGSYELDVPNGVAAWIEVSRAGFARAIVPLALAKRIVLEEEVILRGLLAWKDAPKLGLKVQMLGNSSGQQVLRRSVVRDHAFEVPGLSAGIWKLSLYYKGCALPGFVSTKKVGGKGPTEWKFSTPKSWVAREILVTHDGLRPRNATLGLSLRLDERVRLAWPLTSVLGGQTRTAPMPDGVYDASLRERNGGLGQLQRRVVLRMGAQSTVNFTSKD